MVKQVKPYSKKSSKSVREAMPPQGTPQDGASELQQILVRGRKVLRASYHAWKGLPPFATKGSVF